MAGKKATTTVTPGEYALSVNNPGIKHPKSWVYVSLLDVSTLATGHTPSRKYPEYWGGNIPWMSVGDARKVDGKSITKTKQYTNQLGIDNSAAVLLPKDTVCLSRTASIGYAVRLGTEMATSQGFVNFICSPILLPKFLQSLFLAERRFLYSISEGTAHTTIYYPEVKAFNIALPPLAEQQRIVNKLDTIFKHLDALKTRLDNIPKLLKNFRQAILTQAVTGKLTEEWRVGRDLGFLDYERLKELKSTQKRVKWLGSEMLESINRNKSWKPIFLGDLLKLITDGSHHSPKIISQGYPYITVRDLSWNNTIDIKNSKRISKEDFLDLEKNGCRPIIGDVLFSKDGTVGKVYQVKENTELVVLSSLAILRPFKEFCSSEYLSVLMQSPFVLNQAINKKTGTAIRRIVLKNLKEVVISVPSVKEQTEIVKRVEHLFTKANAIEAQYQTLKTKIDSLPQAILAKAFKGELVAQLDTDGDAKVLLAEIQKLKTSLSKKPSLRGTKQSQRKKKKN